MFREADLQIDHLILLDHLPIEKENESVSVPLRKHEVIGQVWSYWSRRPRAIPGQRNSNWWP